MEKEFVPYELAVKLKALDYDEPCFATWNGETLDMSLQVPSDDYFTKSPTFSQAFRWFREKNRLFPHIFSNEIGTFVWCIRWYVDNEQKDTPYFSSITYEEAELACLDKLIEIVETKQQEQ